MERRRGPKSALDNPRTRAALLRLLREGATAKDACRLLPINPTTFYRSKDRDKELAEQIEKAQAEGKHLHIKTIHTAAKGGDAKASMWWLERVHWEEYARRKPEQLGVAQVLTIVMPALTELIVMLPEDKRAAAGERLELMAEKLQLEAKKSG